MLKMEMWKGGGLTFSESKLMWEEGACLSVLEFLKVQGGGGGG